MRRPVAIVMLLGAMLGCGTLGQAAELKALLLGEEYALALQMKDLDGQWRRLSAGGGAEAGGLAQVYAAMFGGGGGVYYTKGETVSVGSETYLIAYTRRTKPVDYATVMQRGPGPRPAEEVTAESLLSLSLLNLRTIGSLVDIRPFNFEKELAAFAEEQAASAEQESLSNLKNLALAVQMFLADNNDVMPDISDIMTAMEVLNEYVRNEGVFFHPETGNPYVPNAALSGVALVEVEDPVSTAVFYEDSPGADGKRGVAFLDGHAARVTESEWRKIKEAVYPGQASLSNLKNLALAVQMFLTDNNDVMPDMSDVMTAMDVLDVYVKNEGVFFHPGTGDPYVPNAALSGVAMVEVEDPVSVAVFYEDSPGADGTRGVAFLDGHAARVTEGQWQEIKEVSKIP